MVLSKRSLQNVVYNEDASIDLDDKGKELIQYTIPLFEYPSNTVALGEKCTRFEKKGIIYHNCYLITNDGASKIGVFEFPRHHYESYLERDNPKEIMCSKLLPHLLLFSDARNQVQHAIHAFNAGKALGSLDNYTPAKLALPHVESVPFSLDMVKPDTSLTKIEHEDQYLGIDHVRFLPKTDLVSCLSTVLHKQIHQTEKTTNAYLRGILADHVTVSMFDTLKSMYTILHDKVEDNKKIIKHLKQELAVHKSQMEDVTTWTMQIQHAQTSQKYIKSLLKDKEYLANLENVDELKQYIQSAEYICEPWTIGILERLMNLKIILLSKDIPKLLVCSRQSPFPHNMSLFNPMYYTILEFTGNDYRILEVKGVTLLTFETIPLIIKDLVINRCVEQNEGMYANIPLFVKYKQFKLTGEQQQDTNEPMLDLNPEKDRLVISDSLKKHVQPGSVPFERMDFENILDSHLVRDKQWREKLTDNYIKPDGRFTLGDKEWASVNHYVTAQQLKEKDPSRGNKLSLSTGSSLSKKTIPYMVGDNDDRYSGEFAKFSQNPPLKDILLQTGDAELYMYVPGKSHIRLHSLEKVRNTI